MKLGDNYKDVIAIDFETHPISNEFPYPKPICLSYSGSQGNGIVVGEIEMEQFLHRLLQSQSLILAHNMKFEAIVIYNWFPKLRKLLWDAFYNKQMFCTLIYEQLIDNISKSGSQKKSLDALVSRYLRIDISESKKSPYSWRLKYWILDDIPLNLWPQPAIDYSINDSIYTLQVFNCQQDFKPGLAFNDHVLPDFTLNIMAQQGMLVDKSRIFQLEKELLDYLNPRYTKLIESGYAARDKKTGKIKKAEKKLREYIKDNVTDVEYTAKGAVSTSTASFDRYIAAHPNDEILTTFDEIGQYEKALTAFVSRLKEACIYDVPLIRSEYNSIVSSGRTSARTSSLYPSVNIQQMPRDLKGVTWDVRNCFIPRPGYKLVSIDYSGLELSSAAHQLYRTIGYSKMRDKLNSGSTPTDLHSVLGAQLMSMKGNRHCSYETFKANRKLPEYDKIRKIAKIIGLGKPGGIGRDIMRNQMAKEGIYPGYAELHKSKSQGEIEQLVMKYKGRYPNIRSRRLTKDTWALIYDELIEFDRGLYTLYPELREFLRERHERYMTGETKYVQNDFGEWEREPVYRYQVAGVTRDWCTYTELCNGYLMQTPGAIGAKRAMNWIIEKYIEHPDVNPLAFIHDEILFEVKDDDKMWTYIEDVASMMCKAMQLTLTSVRITVEASTMDYWSKSKTLEDRTYFLNPSEKQVKVLQ